MINCLVRSLRRRRPSMRLGVLSDVADKAGSTVFAPPLASTRTTMRQCRMLGFREFGNANAVIIVEILTHAPPISVIFRTQGRICRASLPEMARQPLDGRIPGRIMLAKAKPGE